MQLWWILAVIALTLFIFLCTSIHDKYIWWVNTHGSYKINDNLVNDMSINVMLKSNFGH